MKRLLTQIAKEHLRNYFLGEAQRKIEQGVPNEFREEYLICIENNLKRAKRYGADIREEAEKCNKLRRRYKIK